MPARVFLVFSSKAARISVARSFPATFGGSVARSTNVALRIAPPQTGRLERCVREAAERHRLLVWFPGETFRIVGKPFEQAPRRGDFVIELGEQRLP